MDEDHEALGDDPAAAFEALRTEVAALRASLGDGRPAPDYAPTLGKMAATLAKIEAHPALQLTPHAYAQQLRAMQEAAQRQGEHALTLATDKVSNAAGELARTMNQAHAADRQNWRLLQVGAGGFVLGATLWAVSAGPIARTLPASWVVPETMAAATLALDRWHAGERLMQSENLASWQEVVGAAGLAKMNEPALASCRAVAARTARPKHCNITVNPPPK